MKSDSTGSEPWINRIDSPNLFDSIQQFLFEIPAEGDVWKEMEFSETISLEIADFSRNKRTLYFNDGILVAPGNSAYYSTSSEVQQTQYLKWSALYKKAKFLLNSDNLNNFTAIDTLGINQGESLVIANKLDTISIVYGDSVYYEEFSYHLIRADGSPGIDQTRSVFKNLNPDAFYIIHSANGPAVEFEGRIKPGKKYHGNCKRYFNQTKQIKHIASETEYFNGTKHGREVHYERNGKTNWQKQWEMGKHIPNIKN